MSHKQKTQKDTTQFLDELQILIKKQFPDSIGYGLTPEIIQATYDKPPAELAGIHMSIHLDVAYLPEYLQDIAQHARESTEDTSVHLTNSERDLQSLIPPGVMIPFDDTSTQ